MVVDSKKKIPSFAQIVSGHLEAMKKRQSGSFFAGFTMARTIMNRDVGQRS
jgi:hypothetical protein